MISEHNTLYNLRPNHTNDAYKSLKQLIFLYTQNIAFVQRKSYIILILILITIWLTFFEYICKFKKAIKFHINIKNATRLIKNGFSKAETTYLRRYTR